MRNYPADSGGKSELPIYNNEKGTMSALPTGEAPSENWRRKI
ncbi:MAG: hypothetical protein XD54_1879 [Thermococcus sibiricus]|uniref:Uncharacterized protein n=1 Tax=Thermococcus sibiricus TaxID=172049 RepID=A0A101EKA5_9EURY|nr:MAG: hypothetical protein XD54_1879 [Thermococcus sibiricus]